MNLKQHEIINLNAIRHKKLNDKEICQIYISILFKYCIHILLILLAKFIACHLKNHFKAIDQLNHMTSVIAITVCKVI